MSEVKWWSDSFCRISSVLSEVLFDSTTLNWVWVTVCVSAVIRHVDSLTLGCQFSYCFCRLAPMVSRAFCGLMDRGSGTKNKEISGNKKRQKMIYIIILRLAKIQLASAITIFNTLRNYIPTSSKNMKSEFLISDQRNTQGMSWIRKTAP